MDDEVRRSETLYKISCISCITVEDLEVEKINMKVQKLLLAMNRKECKRFREKQLAKKYAALWRDKKGLMTMKRKLQKEMKSFCLNELNNALVSLVETKKYLTK